MCSENPDVERFISFYEDKIKDGYLERTPKFDLTKIAVRLLPDKSHLAQQMKLLKESARKKARSSSGPWTIIESSTNSEHNEEIQGLIGEIMKSLPEMSN